MSVKTEKWIYFILTFLVMSLVLWFTTSNQTQVIIISGLFLSGAGGFLGFDLAGTLKDTSSLKSNKYEPMQKSRYLAGAVIFSLLYGQCVAVEYVMKVTLEASKTMFASAVMAILVALLVGTQANTVAARVSGEKDTVR